MKHIETILSWLLSLSIPFLILITSIRLLLTPLFPQIEYHTPNFPDDYYGFTLEDRLHWSSYAIKYLTNDSDIAYLQDLQFPDGTALYNQRELSHMVDVKTLVQKALLGWSILIILHAAVLLWAWRKHWPKAYFHALGWGGRLTIGLIAAILLGVFTGFDALFTGFHRVFFEGSTWLFLYSDTLIRLFPMRFWRDAFILVGLFTLTGAVLLLALETNINKRKTA